MAKKRSSKEPTVAALSESAAPNLERVIRANINRRMVSSESFVSLYTNDSQVQITPWDFRLIFGLIANMPTAEDPSVLVNIIADVRMSPQHAKRLAMVLVQQVQNYEQNVGPIPQPAD